MSPYQIPTIAEANAACHGPLRKKEDVWLITLLDKVSPQVAKLVVFWYEQIDNNKGKQQC